MLTNRFGFQLVVMTGGLLISAGTIASSFTTSINQMYITYGLIAGIEVLTFSLVSLFELYILLLLLEFVYQDVGFLNQSF